MLKVLLLAAIATVALAQILPIFGLPFATAFGYRFEYDDEHNVTIVVSSTDCYLISAPDAVWDPVIHDRQHAQTVAEDIYNAIHAGTGVTALTQAEATAAYHSMLETWQCARHTIHQLAFTPS